MIRTSRTFAALSVSPLLFGGEFKLVAGNIAVCLITVLLLKLWPWVLVAIAFHVFLVQIAKKEGNMRQIYMRYSRQGDRYEPWTTSDPSEGLRPIVVVQNKDLL